MSKQCPKCGNILNDDALFCNSCGQKFGNAQNYQQQGYQQQGYQQQGYQKQQQYAGGTASGAEEIICDSDEKVMMSLQNSYAQNLVSDMSVGSTRVFFTNKRFYAKENRFTLKKGLTTKNSVVRLNEISGTQIVHENPFQLFIWAGLFFFYFLMMGITASASSYGDEGVMIMVVCLFLGMLVAGVFVLLYFLRRGTYLMISFPGDTISIRVKMYSYNSVVTFLRGLQSYIGKIK